MNQQFVPKMPHWAPELLVGGLHNRETALGYLFRGFKRRHSRLEVITIGRKRHCTLQLDDPGISHVHAVVTQEESDRREPDQWFLRDAQSTNGIYIDGELMDEPTRLVVGMRITIGNTLLIVTDPRGRFPILAANWDEFHRRAIELYGSVAVANRMIGYSERKHRQLAKKYPGLIRPIPVKQLQPRRRPSSPMKGFPSWHRFGRKKRDDVSSDH